MAGVDILNQFPTSRMARAVKVGQSRFISVDAPSSPVGAQNNISIAAVTALTVPTVSNDTAPVSYAAITAIGGPLYITTDGSIPSPTNYTIAVAQGGSVPLTGSALAAAKIIGTQMSVEYMR